MTNNMTETINAVGKIYRVMKEHIRSGNDAHSEATWFKNGFLNTFDKMKLTRLVDNVGNPNFFVTSTENFYSIALSKDAGLYTFYSQGGAINGTTLSIRGFLHKTNDSISSTYILGVDVAGNIYSNFYSSDNGWVGWQKQVQEVDSGWIQGTLINGVTGSMHYRLITKGAKRTVLVKFNLTVSNFTSTILFATIPSPYKPTGLTFDYRKLTYATAPTGYTYCTFTINANGECGITPVMGAQSGITTVTGQFEINV